MIKEKIDDFIPPGLICCLMYLPGEDTTDRALCIGEGGGLMLVCFVKELFVSNLFTCVTFGDLYSSRSLVSLRML